MLLKPPVRFSRPAQLYFGLEQAYLVSFTSSVMLGSYCLTSRFQGLARNFLFCSLLDENRSSIFSLRVDSRMLPTPISFCPPSLYICIRHSSRFSHSAFILPLKLFLIVSAAVMRKEREHLFPMPLGFLLGMCYHRIYFPTEITLL